MKLIYLFATILLSLLFAPQVAFAQSDIDVGGTVLESPTSKITGPAIGPPRVATTPAKTEEKRTTLVQFPEEEGIIPFIQRQQNFLLGLIVATEIFAIIYLIYLLRRKRKKQEPSNP